MYALLVQFEVAEVTHQVTFESVEEGEIVGFVVDGVWVELVPTADGDNVHLEIDLDRVSTRRWGFRARPLAAPRMLLTKDSTGTVGVSGTGDDWKLTVAVRDSADQLPEVFDDIGDLEVGIDGPLGHGGWIVHDPQRLCLIWGGETLVCPSADEGVGVEIHELAPHKRGWSQELVILAATSQDVLHGNSASGDYSLDLHWVPVPVAQ